MELQCRNRPHLRNSSLNALLQSASLVVSVHDDQDTLGSHHRPYAYRQSRRRHLVDIAIEETRIGNFRVERQRFLARARRQRRTRLVESDMSVRAHASKKQIDASIRSDFLLISGAFCFQIGSIAIQDIDILLFDIDVAEKVIPHERMVAFGMLFRKTAILIHVERNDMFKRNFSRLVQLNQFLIHAKRRAARRATQHKGLFRSRLRFIYSGCHIIGSPLRHFFVIRFDN